MYKFLNLRIIHMWITYSNPNEQSQFVLKPVGTFKVGGVVFVKPSLNKSLLRVYWII